LPVRGQTADPAGIQQGRLFFVIVIFLFAKLITVVASRGIATTTQSRELAAAAAAGAAEASPGSWRPADAPDAARAPGGKRHNPVGRRLGLSQFNGQLALWRLPQGSPKAQRTAGRRPSPSGPTARKRTAPRTTNGYRLSQDHSLSRSRATSLGSTATRPSGQLCSVLPTGLGDVEGARHDTSAMPIVTTTLVVMLFGFDHAPGIASTIWRAWPVRWGFGFP
jgi:hypothetical protein